MKLPKKYNTFLALLIEIAHRGNDYEGNLTEGERLKVGACIADIQNNLGELNDSVLAKLGLHYEG